MARRKKEPNMGRTIVAAGLFLKIVQIVGAAFSFEALTGSIMTLVTTCLLAGGLAVFAIERMNITGAFALLSLVGVIGGMFPGKNSSVGFIFLSLTFIAFAVMLFTTKKQSRMYASGAVILLYLFLSFHLLGIFSLPLAAITAVLVLIYGIMGAGLFLK